MFARRFIFAIGICLAIACLCSRRAVADSATVSATQQPLPSLRAAPSPSGGRPAVYTLPPDKLRKAIALDRIRNILGFGGTAWPVLILILVLALRWPALLRNRVAKVTPRCWLQGLIFLPIAIVFLVLMPLPLQIYGHHSARAYGLSVQPWGGWAVDQMKGLLLSVVVFTPLLLLLFWMIRRSPRGWWIWFWLCTIPVIVFGVFISPTWIDPIFNHFSPLQKSDPQLTAQLGQLAQHAGLDIPPARIFLMRASDKVTGENAYVTGIGASKRIVVWDNTVHELPPDEILFIVGHEMGHYVLDHIYKGLAFTFVVLFVGLWLVYLFTGWLIRRHGPGWEIHNVDDWAALAVLVLAATCISFLLSPIANSFSRWEEHQADVFGQEAIHGLVANPQHTAERAFTALGSASLDAPNPNRWIEFWLDSHPSTSQRFAFAAHYDPWTRGEAPRYFRK
jgi:STE24 endopeptidase